MFKKISHYFGLAELGTNYRREILAGIATFLSLSYIFIVNPAILGQAGMNVEAVTFATIVASGLTTLIMGIWARLPFALAPGLEMNGFFAFVVVGIIGLTRQQSLGIVFRSGILCLLFTIVPFRRKIIEAIPDGLKSAISFSVGVFVLTIGLFLAGIVTFQDGRIVDIGGFFTPKAIVLYIGLIIAIVLGIKKIHSKFPAGMLVAIIVAAIYAVNQGITSGNDIHISSAMFSAVGELDLRSFL